MNTHSQYYTKNVKFMFGEKSHSRHGFFCNDPDGITVFDSLHGADDAINLDGGGSTTLAINGEVANQSSDPEPRSVADALLLVRDRE